MHLTDNELVNVSTQNQQHLNSCNLCQQKQQIILGLHQIDQQEYSNISDKLDFKQTQKRIFSDQRMNDNHRKSWVGRHVTHYRLVASIFIIAFGLTLLSPTGFKPSMNEFIQESNLLTEKIKQLSSTEISGPLYEAEKTELYEIDEQLQLAYLHNENSEKLATLWQLKVQILNKQLSSKLTIKLSNTTTELSI